MYLGQKQKGKIQPWPFGIKRLLNKPYKNEVTLREKNLSLKCCQSLELLIYFEREFRSFPTDNKGSINQRAAKLPSVQL